MIFYILIFVINTCISMEFVLQVNVQYSVKLI